MIIELDKPYSDLWKSGYLVVNKEPRRNVILYNSPTDRTTVSFARYTMSVNLGKFIDDKLVVDHINDDKMDDRIENYQLLTVEENNIKSLKKLGKTQRMVEFKCGSCGSIFTKKRNNSHLVIKSKKTDYCSRSCAGKSLYSDCSEIIREFRI